MDAEQAKQLRAAFPSSAIGKLPKAGIELDYVGHAATTDRLLSVDPDWTWEPVAFDAVGLPAFTGEGGLWIRLTVCGVTRFGYGDGASVKECIGDAIRNAAMRFGVALDLWAKEDLSSVGETTAEASNAAGDVGAQAAPVAAASPASSGTGGDPQSLPAPDAPSPDDHLNDEQAKAIRDLFGGHKSFQLAAQARFGEHIRRAADLTVAQANELKALKAAAA